MDYKILWSNDDIDLSKRLSKLMNNWWRPQGWASISVSPRWTVYVWQAVIRRKNLIIKQ